MSQTTTKATDSTALVSILTGAIAWAFAPAIIHETLHANSAFIFGSIIQLVECVALVLIVVAIRGRLVQKAVAIPKLKAIRPREYWRLCFREDPPYHQDTNRTATTDTATLKEGSSTVILADATSLKDFFRLPLVLILVGSGNFALLALAAQFVETAIAAAIFETWPIWLMIGLTGANRMYDRYNRIQSVDSRSTKAEHISLSAIAVVGLFLMLLSQVGHFGAVWSLQALLGMALAAMAAILDAVGIVGTITLGRIIHNRLSQRTYTSSTDGPIASPANEKHYLQEVYVTLLATAFFRLLSVPLQFATGLLLDRGIAMDLEGLAGASVLGLAVLGS